MLDKMSKVLEWFQKNHAFVAWVMAMLSFGWGMVMYFNGKSDVAPPLPPPPPPIVQPQVDEFSFGWHEDRQAADAFAATLQYPEFSDTPAGKAQLQAGGPAQLWKDVEAVWKSSRYKNGQPYPNVNQKSVGCCVGCASKHCMDTVTACQVMQHTGPGEWRPFSVEAVYAFSRVDVGQGRIRGDGSNGSWAAEAIAKYGNLSMDKYDGADLTTFDPMKAREWGSRGVPSNLKPEAKKFTASVTRVRTWEDCKKALDQEYPVILTSNQGFEGRRDRSTGRLLRDQDGFLAPGGQWPHAMALIGYKGSPREGGFILNSWGDDANAGPRGEGDPPAAGFYADASVINRMCQSGDCWAVSNFAGFPARKLRIRVSSPRRPSLTLLTHEADRCDRFSLAF